MKFAALFLCVLSQVVGAQNIIAFRGESDLYFMPSTERRETFHKQQDPLYRKKLSPEISSPRRLRVRGADTDSLKGCRFESGETGILVADGLLEDGSSANAARPGGTYTTAVLPGQNLPFISRHVQLPSIDPLPAGIPISHFAGCVGECGVERDVPAIQETRQVCVPNHQACLLFNSLVGISEESHECGCGRELGPVEVWTCSDKNRVLLTAEDGTKHCIKF